VHVATDAQGAGPGRQKRARVDAAVVADVDALRSDDAGAVVDLDVVPQGGEAP
jgi:hypothetical protein